MQQGLTLVPHCPVPEPKDRQVRIALDLAGICATDLEMVAGYNSGSNLILGHEFVGTVECSPSAPHWEGQRVVGEINVGCGACADCRRQEFSHCPGRTCLGIFNHDGAFADYLVLPAVNLHAVPDSLRDTAAVLTEPVAAALQIQEQLMLSPETRIGILGAGKLGTLVALTLQSRGYPPLAFCKYPRQAEVLQAHGVETVEVSGARGPGLQHEMHHRFDVVIECAATPTIYDFALELVRPRGTLVIKSTLSDAGHLDLNTVVVNEIQVQGSRCGPFDKALVWLTEVTASGWLDVDSLMDQEFALATGLAAFHRAAQPGVAKVLLRP